MSEDDVLVASMVSVLSQDIAIRPGANWFDAELQIRSGSLSVRGGSREEAIEGLSSLLSTRLRESLALLGDAGVDVVALMTGKGGRA